MREIIRNAPPDPWPRPPFPAEPPLTAGLADLAWLWLNIRCDCGKSTSYPLRRLAAERGWQTTLGDVLPKLQCRKCGARPASIELVDNATIDAPGLPSRGKGNRMRLV